MPRSNRLCCPSLDGRWFAGKSSTRIATFWMRTRNSSGSESKVSSATLTKSSRFIPSPLTHGERPHRVASVILFIVVTFIVRDVSFIFLIVLFLVSLFPKKDIASRRAIRTVCVGALWAYSAHVPHGTLCPLARAAGVSCGRCRDQLAEDESIGTSSRGGHHVVAHNLSKQADRSVLHSRRAIHADSQTSHRGDGDRPSSELIDDVDPWRNHAGRWARDGSCTQYLVGWCSGGDRHHRRLDNAPQEPALVFPAA